MLNTIFLLIGEILIGICIRLSMNNQIRYKRSYHARQIRTPDRSAGRSGLPGFSIIRMLMSRSKFFRQRIAIPSLARGWLFAVNEQVCDGRHTLFPEEDYLNYFRFR